MSLLSQDYVAFYCRVVFCCRDRTRFLSPLPVGRHLFLVLSNDEYSSFEYSCLSLGVDMCFHFSLVPR